MPDGVYEVPAQKLPEWRRLAQEEVDSQAFFEALVLQMKANGKELDPRFFNEEEKKGFDV